MNRRSTVAVRESALFFNERRIGSFAYPKIENSE